MKIHGYCLSGKTFTSVDNVDFKQKYITSYSIIKINLFCNFTCYCDNTCSKSIIIEISLIEKNLIPFYAFNKTCKILAPSFVEDIH